MTRKRLKRQVARQLGATKGLKIRVFNDRGRCTAHITSRTTGRRVVVASAPTWDLASRQARSGYFCEVPR